MNTAGALIRALGIVGSAGALIVSSAGLAQPASRGTQGDRAERVARAPAAAARLTTRIGSRLETRLDTRVVEPEFEFEPQPARTAVDVAAPVTAPRP